MADAIEVQAETMPAQREQVMTLVQLAVDKGVDVSILHGLMDLQERVSQRDARAAYFEALRRFQEECPPIPKSKKASFTTRKGGRFEYSYAPLEEITEHIRPYEARHGFSHTWDVDLHPAGNALVVGCTLRHVEGHSERSTFPVPVDKGNDALSGAQQNGAALTYGQRKALIMVAGLTTADEDVDGARLDGQMRSVETITAEQAANLTDTIQERGVELRRFLKYFQIEKVGDLPASEHKRAVDLLKQRAAQ